MLNFTQPQKREFLMAAHLTLREFGFTPQLETDPFNDITRKFYREWGGDIKLSNMLTEHDDNTAFAIQDFKAYAWGRKQQNIKRVTEGMETRQIAIDRLEVKVSIPLGQKGRLDFSAQGTIPADADADEKQEYYADLFATVWKGYTGYVNHPEMYQMGGVKKAYSPEPGATTEVIEMTSITSASEGGRRTFKVKGGKFSKHGVRVFGEVLIKAGIDPAEVDGEKYIAGKMTVLYKASGEPHKVVGIEVGGTL